MPAIAVSRQNLQHLKDTFNPIAKAFQDRLDHMESDEYEYAVKYLTANAMTIYTMATELDKRHAMKIESNRNPRSGECTRCHGKGYIAGFSNVKGGICFKCNGKGK